MGSGRGTGTAVLFVVVALIVIADILLACMFRLVLPGHITETGMYHASGEKMCLATSIDYCPCLGLVDFKKPYNVFIKMDEFNKEQRNFKPRPGPSANESANATEIGPTKSVVTERMQYSGLDFGGIPKAVTEKPKAVTEKPRNKTGNKTSSGVKKPQSVRGAGNPRNAGNGPGNAFDLKKKKVKKPKNKNKKEELEDPQSGELYDDYFAPDKIRAFSLKRSVADYYPKMIRKHPYFVSITEPAFIDDDQRIFSCNGVAIAKDKAFIKRSCIRKPFNSYADLQVRSFSIFWSRYGITHKISKSTIINDHLVEITVNPGFRQFGNFEYTNNTLWQSAISIAWDETIYEQKLSKRLKFKIAKISLWTTSSCEKQESKTCDDSCELTSSVPVITLCNEFAGMLSPGEKDCNFGKSFKGDQCYPVYERICSRNDLCSAH